LCKQKLLEIISGDLEGIISCLSCFLRNREKMSLGLHNCIDILKKLLYSILIEFGIPMEVFSLNKALLHEACFKI
jgi:hypothetical protein